MVWPSDVYPSRDRNPQPRLSLATRMHVCLADELHPFYVCTTNYYSLKSANGKSGFQKQTASSNAGSTAVLRAFACVSTGIGQCCVRQGDHCIGRARS